MIYKVDNVGKWTSNFFELLCLAPVLRIDIMVSLSPSSVLSLPSNRLKRSPLRRVPKIVPIVKSLTAKELDNVSPLVLWHNFDEDNIESFPQGWLSS